MGDEKRRDQIMKFNGGEAGMLKRKKIGVRLADVSSRRTEGQRREQREAWHMRKGRRGRAQKIQERGEGWIAGDGEKGRG